MSSAAQSQSVTPSAVAAPAASAPPPPLIITRTFSVPQERVFKAWTTADQLARWFSPTDQYEVKAILDLRVGGAYRIEMHHSGGNVNTVIGIYQLIDAPKKLAFTWRWEGSPPPDTLVTIDFVPRGEFTDVTMTHEKLPTLESRDQHEKGWIGCMGRLDHTLASEA